ncbi:MAG: tetratricopeptide repeat protein [Vicingaceae bacterium]
MKFRTTTLLTLALGFAASTAVAQKAKVVSAYNYNKSFERDKECDELVKGVEAIEPATKDDKTKDWAKTWYYGGNLYFNAALNEDADCRAKFEDPLNKTLDFYINAMKYNIEEEGAKDLDLENQKDQMKFMGYLMNKDTKFDDPTYMRDILGNKFPYLANAFVNKGVESFQNGEFEKAKEFSEKSVMVNGIMGRFDSLGMYNAALAAERLKLYDEALSYYTVLTQVNYGGPEIYLYMANIHDRSKDTTKKMEVIRKGLEKYPNNTNLILEELSYLMATGKTEEAMGSFDKAIANEPNNPSLYYNRGYIFDQMKEYEKAAEDYKKAKELDPKFFDAIYNLGAMYYNQGVEWNNKASSYDIKEKEKYETATKKANEYFEKAKPVLENAHELNPEDKSTMASLVKIYAILGENDKYTKMKAKLQK